MKIQLESSASSIMIGTMDDGEKLVLVLDAKDAYFELDDDSTSLIVKAPNHPDILMKWGETMTLTARPGKGLDAGLDAAHIA